jgi:hypothetical protein
MTSVVVLTVHILNGLTCYFFFFLFFFFFFSLSPPVTEAVTTCVLRVGNDPSVGLVKIREHVASAVPQLVAERERLEQLREPLGLLIEDMDYAVLEVRAIPELPQFGRIKRLLQRSILGFEAVLGRYGTAAEGADAGAGAGIGGGAEGASGFPPAATVVGVDQRSGSPARPPAAAAASSPARPAALIDDDDDFGLVPRSFD